MPAFFVCSEADWLSKRQGCAFVSLWMWILCSTASGRLSIVTEAPPVADTAR